MTRNRMACGHPDGASRWWLHGSLAALSDNLEKRRWQAASVFRCRRGDRPEDRRGIPMRRRSTGSRRYGPEREVDAGLKQRFRDQGLETQSFASRLLYEPGQIRNQSGDFYKGLHPFNRACVRAGNSAARAPPRTPRNPARRLCARARSRSPSRWIELALEPQRPDWAGGLRESWERVEDAAQEQPARLYPRRLVRLRERSRPPRYRVALAPLPASALRRRFFSHPASGGWECGGGDPCAREALAGGLDPRDYDSFRAEIGWRDFSYQLLLCAWPDCGAEH